MEFRRVLFRSLHGGSVFRGDVPEADVLADDRSIFALHQGVVIAVPRLGLGLLDQQFVQQLGHDVVDELTAVVGMKTQNAEGKLPEQGLQHGFQSASLICAVALTTSHCVTSSTALMIDRSEEHTSELQSLRYLVCRLLLE